MQTGRPQEPSLIPRIVTDASSLIVAQLLIAVSAILISVVTARGLGPEGRGAFGLANLLQIFLVTFLGLGMGQAGTRLIATRRWAARDVVAAQLLVWLIHVLLGMIAGAALVIFAGDRLFPGVDQQTLLLGLLSVPGGALAALVLPLLIGIGHTPRYSGLLLASSLLALATLAAAWWAGILDQDSALVLQAVCALAIGAWATVRVMQAAGGLGRPRADYLREAYRFGGGVFASTMLRFAGNRFGLLLVNGTTGAAGVGFYTLAATAAERIFLLADGASTALMPRIAADAGNSRRLTPVAFRATLVLSAVAAAGLFVMADLFVHILYSPQFEAAVEPLRILLLGAVPASGWRVLEQDLNARGHSVVTAGLNGLGAVVTLGATAALLPGLGLAGAAWGAFLGAASTLAAGAVVFRLRGDRDAGRWALFQLTVRERTLLSSPGWIASIPRAGWSSARSFFASHGGSRVYWLTQAAIRRVVGSRLEERRYRNRPGEEVRRYFSIVESPHRLWLRDALCSTEARSLLEVGSGFGPNLEVVHRAAPDLTLAGIDISPASVAEGRRRFHDLGLDQITLVQGSAEAMLMFSDRQFDVVFTDAALMYVGPDKIRRSLGEMLRIARHHLVLLEMTRPGDINGQYTRDGWIRDYASWLSGHARVLDVQVERLPEMLRPTGRWPVYGTLIRAALVADDDSKDVTS